MAINVALPLSGLSDMFEGCCLLSPISPIDVTFRENFKMMVSPDSESSSGVSSFDSADAIKYQSAQHLRSSSPSTTDSSSSSSSSSSSTPSEPSTPDGVPPNSTTQSSFVPEQQTFAARLIAQRQLEEAIYRHENRPIMYKGRNLLDLASNLDNSWQLKYAELPENNLKMFLANRSQYHRLSAAGHIQEYTLTTCRGCDFSFPHVEMGPVAGGSGSSSSIASGSVAQSMLSTMLMTPPPAKHSPVPSISALQQQQQQQELFNRIYKMNLANNQAKNLNGSAGMMGGGNNNNMHGNIGNSTLNNNTNNNNIFNNIGTFNAANNNNSANNNITNGFMNQMNNGPKPIRGANYLMNNMSQQNSPSNINNNAAFMKFMRASNGGMGNNLNNLNNNNNSSNAMNSHHNNVGNNNHSNYNNIMNSNHQINPNGGNNTPFKMYKHF